MFWGFLTTHLHSGVIYWTLFLDEFIQTTFNRSMDKLLSLGIKKHTAQLHDSKPFGFLKTSLNYSVHLTCRCATASYKYFALKRGSKRNAIILAPVVYTRKAIRTASPQCSVVSIYNIGRQARVLLTVHKLDPTR